MPKRRYRRRQRGGTEEGGTEEGGGQTEPVMATRVQEGDLAGRLRNMQETVQTSSQATLRKAFKNPHGTNAFFACLFVLVIPLTIYSFMGKSDSVFLNEIMLSFMAMSLAASGISYFLLQEQDGDYFVTGFLGISVLSFLGWCYFAWKIMNPEDDDKKD